MNKQSLKIHLVEAGKEFGVLMVFWVGKGLWGGGVPVPDCTGAGLLENLWLGSLGEMGAVVQDWGSPRSGGGLPPFDSPASHQHTLLTPPKGCLGAGRGRTAAGTTRLKKKAQT